MKRLSTEEVISLLDHRRGSIVGSNHLALAEAHGLDALVPYYITAFPRIRNSPGRIEILFWLVRYARIDVGVVALAKSALSDRSRIVRNYACAALAYARDSTALPDLAAVLTHRSSQTREDAQAAISAIEEGNHHLFADRERTGEVFWDPGQRKA